MAEKTQILNRAKRLILWPVAAIASTLSLYLLAAWIGSAIPRNGDWVEPSNGVTIMVEDNGVHTGIVMPLVTPQKDWRTDYPVSDLSGAAAQTAPYTHISISWGEREVFLNTPTWADLTLSTAFGAISSGEVLLHVAHYVRPAPSEYHRELTISEAQYAALVKAIERRTLAAEDRRQYPGYSDYDVFYDAPGTYHLGKTCNQWTSDVLAEAGIKTGWWTPLAGGVMKWVPPTRAER